MRRIALAGLSVVILALAAGLAGAGTRAHAALASAPIGTAHPVIGDPQLGSPCFIAVPTCSIHPCVEFVGNAQSAVLQSVTTATVQALPRSNSAQRCAGSAPNLTLGRSMRIGPGSASTGHRPTDKISRLTREFPFKRALARALAQAAQLLGHRGR